MNTKILGTYGERLAEEFLKTRGYVMIDRNFRLNLGEIDLIARDGDYLCFIEVKTRVGFEVPQEAVSKLKQRKLVRLAYAYLKTKFKSIDVRCRFDVVAIHEKSDGNPHVELIVNAFEADG